jgi:hypothetical protein
MQFIAHNSGFTVACGMASRSSSMAMQRAATASLALLFASAAGVVHAQSLTLTPTQSGACLTSFANSLLAQLDSVQLQGNESARLDATRNAAVTYANCLGVPLSTRVRLVRHKRDAVITNLQSLLIAAVSPAPSHNMHIDKNGQQCTVRAG